MSNNKRKYLIEAEIPNDIKTAVEAGDFDKALELVKDAQEDILYQQAIRCSYDADATIRKAKIHKKGYIYKLSDKNKNALLKEYDITQNEKEITWFKKEEAVKLLDKLNKIKEFKGELIDYKTINPEVTSDSQINYIYNSIIDKNLPALKDEKGRLFIRDIINKFGYDSVSNPFLKFFNDYASNGGKLTAYVIGCIHNLYAQGVIDSRDLKSKEDHVLYHENLYSKSYGDIKFIVQTYLFLSKSNTLTKNLSVDIAKDFNYFKTAQDIYRFRNAIIFDNEGKLVRERKGIEGIIDKYEASYSSKNINSTSDDEEEIKQTRKRPNSKYDQRWQKLIKGMSPKEAEDLANYMFKKGIIK